jgi:hypothetical protein
MQAAESVADAIDGASTALSSSFTSAMPSSVSKCGGLPLKALAPHPLVAGQVELLLDMSSKLAICAVIARRLARPLRTRSASVGNAAELLLS